MKRFLIVAVAALAAVLFTACPDKPKDEPVVIPDGTYEETAHFQYQLLRLDSDTTRIIFNQDTIFSTTVIISNGEFIYPDMCDYIRDTLFNGTLVYFSPFIYNANEYCGSNLIPAKVSDDGGVIFNRPSFISVFGYYPIDSNYVYHAPVSKQDEMYTFQHSHDFPETHKESIYHISHTLRPL